MIVVQGVAVNDCSIEYGSKRLYYRALLETFVVQVMALNDCSMLNGCKHL